jgi:arabinose-5-phosphate isomerase
MEELRVFTDCLKAEAKAICDSANTFGEEIADALNLMFNCQGKIVVTGVGKSGHVGRKIAASLSSTGTPAVFMHATEGVHGDLGMVSEIDVIILISNSGETEEVLNLLPSLKQIGCKKIALTRNRDSHLAQNCEASIIYAYEKEADHLTLAPTVSSTLTLAIGDALAVTLSKMKNFTSKQFHLYHPGGSLGKQLEKKE